MKTKKWRDVKNALVMVVVMAAMMSTATYAWFTLTSNATVTGMQMTAGGSSGLKVSKTLDGQYVDGISLAPEAVDGVLPENQVINQLTIDNTPAGDGSFPVKFFTPKYGTEDEVTGVIGVTQISDIADVPQHAAKYTYFLKLEDANATAPVGIVIGERPSYSVETGLEGTVPKVNGSFVRATKQDDTSAIYAVRIGLVVGNKLYVYEPNADEHITGDDADVTSTMAARTYTSTVKSNVDGTITGTLNTDYTLAADGSTLSKGLFNVNGSNGTQVDMYVWLEGTDQDCVDQVKADEIEAQIQFTIVE